MLVPMTVVETPGFLRDAAAALTEEERTELVSYLAANPEVGELMPETGGAENFVGERRAEENAEERGRSTAITTSRFRFSCSMCSPRMKRQT